MATKNKNVACYLPPNVETALSKFCLDNGIIRKGKEGEDLPSLGTGIVRALEAFFSIETMPKLPTSGMGNVEQLIDTRVRKAVESHQLGEAIALVDRHELLMDEILSRLDLIESALGEAGDIGELKPPEVSRQISV